MFLGKGTEAISQRQSCRKPFRWQQEQIEHVPRVLACSDIPYCELSAIAWLISLLLKCSLMIVHLEREQLGNTLGSEYIAQDHGERNGKGAASSIHF